MNKGFISLHRKILESPLVKMSIKKSYFEAFILLLMKCNYRDKKVLIGARAFEVKRGSCITSQKKLMLEFNWGISRLRNFLELYEKEGMIKVESFSTHTYLTISNYDTYQKIESEVNHKQTTSKLQVKTTNNSNNINKDNKKERTQKFFKKVKEIFDEKFSIYPKSILAEFCDYWTESNPSGKKLRFEKQDVFDINRRLRTWISRGGYDEVDEIQKKEDLIERKYQEQQEKIKKADGNVASEDEKRKALGLK